VSLKYKGAGEETLEDVSIDVRKGDVIGVIGGTGSGKTSFVNLIPKFYEATKGSITLNGKNLNAYDETELRKRVGVVPQKAVLFQGTIRSNLLWGKENATEEEMWRALELAQAKEIVEGKDGMLEAEVAQNGRNFSGGQRQRLTIARALIRRPEILILDDSASALDYATDAKLRNSIKSIKDETTTFIVSQRASSIRHADQILVLEDGRVAGLGTHDELLENCEVYQEIYYSQYPEERKGAVSVG
jgi:ABC-type multidrug transport system fused ATPase/permease subunit